MSSSPISTTLVPPQFLQSAYLTGRIPFRLSRSHPSVSYTLYIPPHAYNPDPSRSSQEPPYNLPLLPLVVTIHGTSRNAEACRNRLKDFADKHHVAVLSPFFPAGITSALDLDSYKLLRAPAFNSDQVLLSIIDDEIAQIWPGYSGGGQFALRMLYIHPSRLDAVSIGAPGRPTFLDENEPWPRGISDLDIVFGAGTKIDIDAIRAVRGIQLLVGSEDNFIHGGEEFMSFIGQFKANMRKSSIQNQQAAVDPSLDAMKEGRLDGLTKLWDSWKQRVIEAKFDFVPGVAHEASKVSPTMMEFLLPLIEDFKKQLLS
ncbi:hypothetical protein LTS15_007107 [Exophiala xenobiotica]|nr:hypothetical protein LTS15_007107 [Exophiala xenobiotica]